MSVGLWVKGTVVMWVFTWGLLNPIFAHDNHRDPHLDPDAYQDLQATTRDQYKLHQVDDDVAELSDDLAIEVRGGEQRAIELAHKYGLHYMDQVFEDPGVYHLHKPRQSNNSNRPRRNIAESKLLESLTKEPGVEWVDQQIALTRDKRRAPKYKIYSSQERTHEVPSQGGEKRMYHNIPADIQKSRRALDKTLERIPNDARRNVPDSHRKEPGNVFNYWKNEETEDRTLDTFGALRHIHSSKDDDQDQGRRDHQHRKTSPENLIRVPLSRNVGYGLGRPKLHLPSPLQDNLDPSRRFSHAGSKGRIYIPRDRQLKDNVNMLSKDDGNEAEEKITTNEPKKNKAKSDDFGKWIDYLVDTAMDFNDPFYNDQWYLHNTGQLGRLGYDLNVTWAWLKGYTGRGIFLSVLDDGLQTTNAEVADNYASNISYSLIQDGGARNDPSPRLDPSFTNSHGTYCAAIMAAVPNNSVCGVGVAYHSKVGGVRIVDGKVTDIQEAMAISRHINQVDVFSASWGPVDDGKKVEGPGKLAKHAFIEGVTKGRGGKGVVYVWASGNGGLVNDNCNLDGYASSIYTLSVSAITDVGTSTFYEEPCASTLAAVYVGGEHTLEAAKENQKKHRKELRVVVPELDGHCSETFQGTSAAAPLMAGVVALVLQANGNLTWRDVQHLVVETSSPTPQALKEPGWHTNGSGKRFHLMQGFGAVNGGKMVAAALNWKNVKPQKITILPMFDGFRTSYPFEWINITHVLDSSAVPSPDTMTVVEHVVAKITILHSARKLLTIFIVSPSGTTSQVLTHRASDEGQAGFNAWGFMSVHFWGEDPQGSWTVAIKDDSGRKGYLHKIEMTIYGS